MSNIQVLSLLQVAHEFNPTTLFDRLRRYIFAWKRTGTQKGKEGETVARIEHKGESSHVSEAAGRPVSNPALVQQVFGLFKTI